jgi:hypothetical protein
MISEQPKWREDSAWFPRFPRRRGKECSGSPQAANVRADSAPISLIYDRTFRVIAIFTLKSEARTLFYGADTIIGVLTQIIAGTLTTTITDLVKGI